MLAHLAQEHEVPLLQCDDALFCTEQGLHVLRSGPPTAFDARKGSFELCDLFLELIGVLLDQELQHLPRYECGSSGIPSVGPLRLLQHCKLAELDIQLLLDGDAVEQFGSQLVEIKKEV